ncbi:hypothetical protein PF011_g28557 [Phytophthora fragariae]|uniref:Uncharacterized protein n=1 Tax=Phytophthora fragariae TaxID=53985 RepID=A0A6A3H527_9STRA|nr:hypothetical protein PF011_g28557 [Phytophthora fragariae]
MRVISSRKEVEDLRAHDPVVVTPKRADDPSSTLPMPHQGCRAHAGGHGDHCGDRLQQPDDLALQAIGLRLPGRLLRVREHIRLQPLMRTQHASIASGRERPCQRY